MKPGARLLLIVILAVLANGPCAGADAVFPGTDWHRIPGREAAWSDSALAVAFDRAARLHSSALMVVARGVVVAEQGDTAARTEIGAIRSSLLGALLGIAAAENKIALDSTLARLGVDDNPPVLTDTEKQATVRMLAQARSGIYHPTVHTFPPTIQPPPRGSHPPGTFWYLNDWDVNALGSILETATGVATGDAFDSRIARPIGMQDFRPADASVIAGPASIHPAAAIRMSTRDLARFALLYARGGVWRGRQVIPADWVRDSTRPYSSASTETSPGAGYGYLWWTAAEDPSAPGPGLGLPTGTFFAFGAAGQTAFIVPSRDLVIVNRVDPEHQASGPTVAESAELVRLILHAGGFDPWPR